MIVFYLENYPNRKENFSASKPILTTNSKRSIWGKNLPLLQLTMYQHKLTKTLALHFHFVGNTTLRSRWTGRGEHICWRENKWQHQVTQ